MFPCFFPARPWPRVGAARLPPGHGRRRGARGAAGGTAAAGTGAAAALALRRLWTAGARVARCGASEMAAKCCQ